MTEHDFERRLRANLRELAEPASAALRASVTAIPEEVPTPLGRGFPTGFPAMLRFAPLALAGAAVLVVVLVGISQLVRTPGVGPPAASVSPNAAESVEPTPSALPSATEGEFVAGWPDTTENRAGLYSWGESRCGRAGQGYCNIGFMHNGYGSGNVAIRIEAGGHGDISAAEGAEVTVAGHEGKYRRIDAQEELWLVEIGGTTIAIMLSAERDTSEADLAEAHAIIDSMRTEPWDNDIGFRLVFRLTTDDWDSG